MTSIGIDLGTTNTCAAAVINGEVVDLGNLLPSHVHWAGVDWRAGRHPESIYDTKRLIGRKYTAIPHNEVRGFTVTGDADNGIRVRTGEHETSPEQVAAVILSEVRRRAEALVGPVVSAVITVPAYFSEPCREATRAAAEIAGLEVLRLLQEPTAAALAAGLTGRVLIWDMGGGTFDVALVDVHDNTYQVLATAGDDSLGGRDLDEDLFLELALQVHEADHIDICADPRLARQALHACEEAKCRLSDVDTTHIAGFPNNMTRAQVNRACRRILARAELAMESISDHLRACHPDHVVMVGGVSRIPYLREKIQERFGRVPVVVDPDRTVARGAALLANSFRGSDSVTLLDVTPLSLGIETAGRVVTRLVYRNTILPCSHTRTFFTNTNDQERVELNVYEGERHEALPSNVIASFELSDLPLGPAGSVEIKVSFAVDRNGLLSVTAVAGNKQALHCVRSRSRLSDAAIKLQASEFRARDQLFLENVNMRNTLENTCTGTLAHIKEGSKLPEGTHRPLQEAIDPCLRFLLANPEAPTSEYDARLTNLQAAIEQIMSN